LYTTDNYWVDKRVFDGGIIMQRIWELIYEFEQKKIHARSHPKAEEEE